MSATSIYVSDSEAVAVVLGGSARSPRINRVERLAFAPPSFDEEGNPYSPETIADLRALELKQWIKSKRLTGKIVATLDSSNVIFRDIFVEFTERKQIDKVIRYQVEGVIPSENIETLCVGYVVDEVSERGSRLTIAAARRRAVRTLVEDLEFAGAKAMSCDSTIGGILNLRHFNEDLANCKEPTVWIDLQDDIALLAVLDGRNILMYRSLHIPSKAVVELEEARGSHVPPPIPGVEEGEEDFATQSDEAGETHIAPKSAENETLAEYPEEIANLETLINLLKIEVRRASISVRASAPITRVVVSGVPIEHQDELAALGEVLEIQFVDLLETLGGAKHDLSDSGLYAATAGVALTGLGFKGTEIDYLSGDLAPASPFDYVKWPIAFALIIMVMCLGFMFVIAFKEPAKLDTELAKVSKAKKVKLKTLWDDLQAASNGQFDAPFPLAESKTNSQLISKCHAEMTKKLSEVRAGDKGNYPPVYPAEKLLGEILNVIDLTVGRHPGGKGEWKGDGRNTNFALEKISISQRVSGDKTDGDVSIELYLESGTFDVRVPRDPGDSPGVDSPNYLSHLMKKTLYNEAKGGQLIQSSLLERRLEDLQTRNPAWDGQDPSSKYIFMVEEGNTGARDVDTKAGAADKMIPRGERLIGGKKVQINARKYEMQFKLAKVSKAKKAAGPTKEP